MSIITGAIASILIADFISGVVHWAEDRYARKHTPIIGKWIAEANLLHHESPRAFVAQSWWQSSWDLLLASLLVVAGAAALGVLTWQVWLFALVTANANQIHKWAHQAPHENGRLVTWLQRVQILQTQRHHMLHHRGTRDTHYCAVTNVLNPLLEEFKFWRRLEWLVEVMTSKKAKADPTLPRAAAQSVSA